VKGPPLPWARWLPASREGKTGFIDRDGRWMIAPQYDCAWRFPEGEDRALVATGDGVGYIEPSGRVVIPPAPYAGRDSFSEGRALFFQYEEGHPLVSGFVDTDGRVVTRMQVEDLGRVHHGLATFTVLHPESKRWWLREPDRATGFVDRDGDVVIPPRFRAAESFGDEGLAAACEEQCGFIDARGRWAIAPEYDMVKPFEFGVALVTRHGKSGFVTTSGFATIPLQFDQLSPFSDGLAWAVLGAESGQIDRTGHFVPALLDSERLLSHGRYSDGLIGTMFPTPRGFREGYVDRDGTVIIPPRLMGMGARFRDGLAPAYDDPQQGYAPLPEPMKEPRLPPLQCGYIDHHGRWIVPPHYGWCGELHDGVAEAEVDHPNGEGWDETTTSMPPSAPVVDYVDASGRVLGRRECSKRWR
jgi:hypothetical protein